MFLYINIKNTIIQSSDKVRFLGLPFDYKLTFNTQIDLLKNKCLRALNIIKFLRSTWSGSNASTLIVLYKSFVRSILDYGCFFCYSSRSFYLINMLTRNSAQFSARNKFITHRASIISLHITQRKHVQIFSLISSSIPQLADFLKNPDTRQFTATRAKINPRPRQLALFKLPAR